MKSETMMERVFKAAGGKRALAEKLGVSVQAVHQWKRVPLARIWDVSRITGIARDAFLRNAPEAHDPLRKRNGK